MRCRPTRGNWSSTCEPGRGRISSGLRGTSISESRYCGRGAARKETAMRISYLLAAASTAALFWAAAASSAAAETLANAQLKDGSGKPVGDVDLVQTPAG